MAGRVRFVLLLHSHQPVGNFDGVIEEAYRQSYLPYAEVFEEFPQVPLTNHFSGCLLEWLDQHHPEYLDRLAAHDPQNVPAGSRAWETVGGGFYEPIMTMLPTADRIGQIRRMSGFIEKRIGTKPGGLWLPERVWEPSLVTDLAAAGVQYLTLDDTHFKAAGLTDADLNGAYVTEDQGHTVRVYPASERLRYMIPYAHVGEILAYLKELRPAQGERVVIYADDGEKFGVWPRTYQHVYTNGWLRQFLGALDAAQREGWLVCSTLAEAYSAVDAVGKVFLPENSYREMTEWALPSKRLAAYEGARHSIQHDPQLSKDVRIAEVLELVKGGNWRSFKVKYPEGNRLYAKMMEVSRKVAELPARSRAAESARTHLYRGQCNCPYWHGVFGGMYLPHLRTAIYRELVRADVLADELNAVPPLQRLDQDFDFDGHTEVKLVNRHLALYLHPQRGGHLYELDLRGLAFNVLDTFSRRFEAYHEKVARAVVGDSNAAMSIHDLVLAKEAGLSELLQYDTYLRESLVDHLSAEPLTPQALLSGHPQSDPGFRAGAYELCGGPAGKRRGARAAAEKSAGVTLRRRGAFNGAQVELTKTVTLRSGSRFSVEYELALAGSVSCAGFFGAEFNASFQAGDAHDRYLFHDGAANAGKLATTADFGVRSKAGLKDEWLKAFFSVQTSVPAQVLACPVKTVSQSEGGFESVYQSTTLLLQWPFSLSAANPSFKVTLTVEAGGV